VEKLSEAAVAESFAFTVQVTDLDYNSHMNNARYGDVILNALGMETLRESSIARLDVNFVSQLFIGDRYEVYKEQKGGIVLFEARKPESGAVVFRARAELTV
jgi:acyl-ACP thioesterase